MGLRAGVWWVSPQIGEILGRIREFFHFFAKVFQCIADILYRMIDKFMNSKNSESIRNSAILLLIKLMNTQL
ncbi:MAG: hypothetical protein A2W23_09480 [Planctomycetes bacterium RBG_16_43_13]|nr:MAG: hypothetical protein A2W23_09480 [Planctomycetes bacterium RBG_16_43_13]